MKITLFDSWRKFSQPIINHWEELGHEVLFNPTWEQAQPSDLIFFYQSDNALVEFTQNKIPDVQTFKVYAQCIDIEVWSGQPFAVDWTKVSGCIFMAKHIRNYVLSKMTFPLNTKRALIKPGIDLEKWTLRPLEPLESRPIRRIAYVVGDRRIWDVKRLDIAFQLLKDLLTADPKHIWQLHIRGTYSTHEQYNHYCQYLEKDLGLEGNIVWYLDRVGDMNKWLDDKDYFLLPSTKEAFSFATAEAMAKGIKPIINNWEGSKDTWNGFVCNTYGEMLAEILRGTYEPLKYRNYVNEHYNEARYLAELTNFILEEGGE